MASATAIAMANQDAASTKIPPRNVLSNSKKDALLFLYKNNSTPDTK